jgi:hypothetical protein
VRHSLLDPVAVETDLVQQRRAGAAQVMDSERMQRHPFVFCSTDQELCNPGSRMNPRIPEKIFTVSSTVNLFCWPMMVPDSHYDVFIFKSKRYISFR